MKLILRIEILITIFILFIIIFSLIYKNADSSLDYVDCLYISAAFQTFTGSSMVDNNKKLRHISTVQIILSYIFIAIILTNVIN
jgi:hypothetical protein